MNHHDLIDATDHPAGRIVLPQARQVGRRTSALAGLAGSYLEASYMTTVSSMITSVTTDDDESA